MNIYLIEYMLVSIKCCYPYPSGLFRWHRSKILSILSYLFIKSFGTVSEATFQNMEMQITWIHNEWMIIIKRQQNKAQPSCVYILWEILSLSLQAHGRWHYMSDLVSTKITIFRSNSNFEENSYQYSLKKLFWSQQHFAHSKTAQLAWFVQNFVVIRLLLNII